MINSIYSWCDEFPMQHKGDDEFLMNVRTNTLRYVKLFEDVADELLPASGRTHDEDIFDVLQVIYS